MYIGVWLLPRIGNRTYYAAFGLSPSIVHRITAVQAVQLGLSLWRGIAKPWALERAFVVHSYAHA